MNQDDLGVLLLSLVPSTFWFAAHWPSTLLCRLKAGVVKNGSTVASDGFVNLHRNLSTTSTKNYAPFHFVIGHMVLRSCSQNIVYFSLYVEFCQRLLGWFFYRLYHIHCSIETFLWQQLSLNSCDCDWCSYFIHCVLYLILHCWQCGQSCQPIYLLPHGFCYLQTVFLQMLPHSHSSLCIDSNNNQMFSCYRN